ncbi:ENTH domain protein [Aspergillus ruber CBS 135680]|uniref:ANTH-domain-containing protein n=1 Tax=Aspergillus ruber (strain CBS 135680) TaxID=1388766 RepID=A0A017SDF6_ASPRC|nr:ANTH-domain-containing protein [Aspergillus ruber CBS 135680]EYE94836.1 ANTH-domain-containing protein [Aspergillus ruber CBS 135680]
MSNFEKSVKGATKVKLAAPKSKYIENILVATHTGDAGVAEIFRTLHIRLRESTWTVVFKALIVIHLMIREGQLDATLHYLSDNPSKLAISQYSEVQHQGHNIRRYADYLLARARVFEDTKTDYVRSGQGRMKRLTVDKGLLRETEMIQKQIWALLRCDLLVDDVENEVSLTAFRLLVLDLMTLYAVMNEGTINVLEHYFEMSRPDSERALEIYKTFTAQTEEVVNYLGVARRFEGATRLEIPKLKHASTDLTRLLEDDLNDPDFDIRRGEYLAQKNGGRAKSSHGPSSRPPPSPKTTPNRPQTAPRPEKKQTDLIDFFDSIEQPAVQENQLRQQQYLQQQQQQQQQQYQQAMQFQQTGFQPQQTGFYAQQTGFQQPQQTGFQQPQQTGFQQPQQTGFNQFGANNPFGQPQPQVPQPLQPTPTGAGFGGYSPQPQSYGYQSNLAPIPQSNAASFPAQQQPQQPQQLQPQHTNPFRQSMLMATPTGTTMPSATQLNRQSTNPFARRMSSVNLQPSSPSQAPAQPIQPQRTGTNPFARNSTVVPQQGLQPPVAAPLRPNPTGSTNPFRQSAFVNQQTGQGWQASGQQGTMGGYEQLDTVPVFPRPGMT